MSKERSNGPVVLVADDEEVIRELLRRRLALEGFEIETAEDGEEALARVAARFVNVVLTDVQMPGVDGIEVLKRVKASSPATKVIIMTAYSSMKTASDAVRLGAYDYLQKPFEHVDAVSHKVRLALGKQRLELEGRELRRKVEGALAAIDGPLGALREAGGLAASAAEAIAGALAALRCEASSKPA